jgi:hypothetical protein
VRQAAAVCALAGSILTRVGWLAAGRRSAAEPAQGEGTAPR